MQKWALKASPRPLFNFGKWPKTSIAYNKLFQKQDILKTNYQRALTSFFLLNPVPLMEKIKKKEQPGTSDKLLFRLQNKFKKFPLSVMYYLAKFDEVIWSGFWVIPKIKPIHEIIN